MYIASATEIAFLLENLCVREFGSESVHVFDFAMQGFAIVSTW